MAGWQSSPFAGASIDFAPIGGLAGAFYDAKNDAMKREKLQQDMAHQQQVRGQANADDAALKSALSDPAIYGPDGSFNAQAAVSKLLQSGNVNAAKKVAEIGQTWTAKKTPLMQNLEAAGLQPGSPEYRQALMASVTKPQTQVNMGYEKAYDKTVGETLAKESVDIQKRGVDGATRASRYKQLGHLLQDPNLYTGTFSETIVNPLKKAGSTLFGMNLEGVGSAEAVQSISKELAADIASKLKPVSNFEIQFAQSILPNLSNSAEGNTLLVELGVRSAERDQKIADAARAYRQINGRLDEGWYDALAQWETANPLVTPEIMQRAQEVAKKAPQNPPLAGVAPRIATDAEYDALPSGSLFIAPDGKQRRKP